MFLQVSSCVEDLSTEKTFLHIVIAVCVVDVILQIKSSSEAPAAVETNEPHDGWRDLVYGQKLTQRDSRTCSFFIAENK